MGVPECPLDATSGPLPEYCSNGVTCKSSKGNPETCNFDYGRTCPDTAWKLTFDIASDKFYCVVPDGHLAVISEGMENPSTDACNSDPSTYTPWECHIGDGCDHKLCTH